MKELVYISLLCALFTDVRKRRIPNKLSGVLFVNGVVLRLLQDGMKGLQEYLVIVLLAIGLLLPAMAKRMMGAGDIKMLAIVSGTMGGNRLPEFWLAVFTLALILALLMKLTGRERKVEEKGVPMAVSICLAYFALMGG